MGSTSSVLALCVATNSNNADEMLDWQDALSEYIKAPALYDLILGPHLPAGFAKKGWRMVESLDYHAGTNTTAAADWSTFVRIVKSRGKSPHPHGLPTGIAKLDEAIGGLGGLTFIGGATEVGKTSLAMSMAIAALDAMPNLCVLWYTLDAGMTRTCIYYRLLCKFANVSLRTLLENPQWSPETLKAICEASDRICQDVLPRMRIVEKKQLVYRHVQQHYKENAQTVSEHDLIEDFYRLMSSAQCVRPLVIIDKLQDLPVPPSFKGNDADLYRANLIAGLLQSSQCEQRPHGVPTICISKIRKASRFEELGVEDLLGVGELGYTAAKILLVWQKKQASDVGGLVPTVIRVGKARGGYHADVEVDFHHKTYGFTNAEHKNCTSTKRAKTSVGANGASDPFAGAERRAR